jgi:hypothetical protein
VKEKPNGNATEKIARGTNQEGMGTLIQVINGAKHVNVQLESVPEK